MWPGWKSRGMMRLVVFVRPETLPPDVMVTSIWSPWQVPHTGNTSPLSAACQSHTAVRVCVVVSWCLSVCQPNTQSVCLPVKHTAVRSLCGGHLKSVCLPVKHTREAVIGSLTSATVRQCFSHLDEHWFAINSCWTKAEPCIQSLSQTCSTNSCKVLPLWVLKYRHVTTTVGLHQFRGYRKTRSKRLQSLF